MKSRHRIVRYSASESWVYCDRCHSTCIADGCRCCLADKAAAVAAVVAPHMQAYGWACPCCQAVSDALEGKTQ